MSTPDKEENHLCKIVGISGSVRPDSYTTRAVALALKGAEELGCQTKLIDLREYQLVFCDGKDDESHFPEGVFRLREEVKHAQGVILGTPEYHGGYSGVLKNALDLMGFEEFEGKMLGLVGVSGGPRLARRTACGRLAARSMRGWFPSKLPFHKPGGNLMTLGS
jgi:NAD(P)H-dependent FMN reductase